MNGKSNKTSRIIHTFAEKNAQGEIHVPDSQEKTRSESSHQK